MNLYVFIDITLASQTQHHLFLLIKKASQARNFNLFTRDLEIIRTDEYLNLAVCHAERLIDWRGNDEQNVSLAVSLSRNKSTKNVVLKTFSKTFANKADLSGYLASLQMNKSEFPKDNTTIKALSTKADHLIRARLAVIPLLLALGLWGFSAMDGAMIYVAPVMGAVTLAFFASIVVHCIGVRMNHQAIADRNYAIKYGLSCQFKRESQQLVSTPESFSDSEDAEDHQLNDSASPAGKESPEILNPPKTPPVVGLSVAVSLHQWLKRVQLKASRDWANLVERVNNQKQQAGPAP